MTSKSSEVVQLDIKTTTYQTILDLVKSEKEHGKMHHIKVGERFVMAQKKYTYWGNGVIKTDYVHIFIVKNFESKKLIERFRETKDGSFKNY